MRLSNWHWTATLGDGSIIKQPPEPAPFLGDLDIAKVIYFTVKRNRKSFSADIKTRTFFINNNVIEAPKLITVEPEFYCFRRVTQHQTGEKEEKIIFGFRGSQISVELIINENGEWAMNLQGSD